MSVGESDRAGWPCCRLPWSHNMGGGDYDKNVYNYRGAWTHEQQCQGRWRPGEEEAPECPHCRQIEMKSGDAILFHGGPEHGNLHGVAGVKDSLAPGPGDYQPSIWTGHALGAPGGKVLKQPGASRTPKKKSGGSSARSSSTPPPEAGAGGRRNSSAFELQLVTC